MVVGPNKKKFRLDSSVLTTKSMNFNTMLNPKIVEGRQLITEGHRLIAKGHLLIANEDDIESMDFIFTTIHHAFDVFSNPVFSNPKEIPFFEILVAANKYGLVFAVKNTLLLALFAETADEDTLKGMSGEKLWKLTMASAFVEDAAAFKAVTRALVLHQQGEYLDFAELWYFTELFALRVCGECGSNHSEDRVLMRRVLSKFRKEASLLQTASNARATLGMQKQIEPRWSKVPGRVHNWCS
ncbi:BTB/POZ domain-containing protein [Colletotrichum kahawae]|uniref:BTB/POZ domain-containing protein n=1 Tax=Colletotrichum kahawae TaxID=34407 RepID=A0AAD9YSA7_COLKA|nr:BTB/POZ domain-containing protein [Colletotrichum kahawae]